MNRYLSMIFCLAVTVILCLVLPTSLVQSSLLACQCNLAGSYGSICDAKTGQCHCKPSFKGTNCDECKQSGLRFPDCDGDEKCKCNKDGSKFDRQRNGPCIDGVSILIYFFTFLLSFQYIYTISYF